MSGSSGGKGKDKERRQNERPPSTASRGKSRESSESRKTGTDKGEPSSAQSSGGTSTQIGLEEVTNSELQSAERPALEPLPNLQPPSSDTDPTLIDDQETSELKTFVYYERPIGHKKIPSAKFAEATEINPEKSPKSDSSASSSSKTDPASQKQPSDGKDKKGGPDQSKQQPTKPFPDKDKAASPGKSQPSKADQPKSTTPSSSKSAKSDQSEPKPTAGKSGAPRKSDQSPSKSPADKKSPTESQPGKKQGGPASEGPSSGKASDSTSTPLPAGKEGLGESRVESRKRSLFAKDLPDPSPSAEPSLLQPFMKPSKALSSATVVEAMPAGQETKPTSNAPPVAGAQQASPNREETSIEINPVAAQHRVSFPSEDVEREITPDDSGDYDILMPLPHPDRILKEEFKVRVGTATNVGIAREMKRIGKPVYLSKQIGTEEKPKESPAQKEEKSKESPAAKEETPKKSPAQNQKEEKPKESTASKEEKPKESAQPTQDAKSAEQKKEPSSRVHYRRKVRPVSVEPRMLTTKESQSATESEVVASAVSVVEPKQVDRATVSGWREQPIDTMTIQIRGLKELSSTEPTSVDRMAVATQKAKSSDGGSVAGTSIEKATASAKGSVMREGAEEKPIVQSSAPCASVKPRGSSPISAIVKHERATVQRAKEVDHGSKEVLEKAVALARVEPSRRQLPIPKPVDHKVTKSDQTKPSSRKLQVQTAEMTVVQAVTGSMKDDTASIVAIKSEKVTVQSSREVDRAQEVSIGTVAIASVEPSRRVSPEPRNVDQIPANARRVRLTTCTTVTPTIIEQEAAKSVPIIPVNISDANTRVRQRPKTTKAKPLRATSVDSSLRPTTPSRIPVPIPLLESRYGTTAPGTPVHRVTAQLVEPVVKGDVWSPLDIESEQARFQESVERQGPKEDLIKNEKVTNVEPSYKAPPDPQTANTEKISPTQPSYKTSPDPQTANTEKVRKVEPSYKTSPDPQTANTEKVRKVEPSYKTPPDPTTGNMEKISPVQPSYRSTADPKMAIMEKASPAKSSYRSTAAPEAASTEKASLIEPSYRSTAVPNTASMEKASPAIPSYRSTAAPDMARMEQASSVEPSYQTKEDPKAVEPAKALASPVKESATTVASPIAIGRTMATAAPITSIPMVKDSIFKPMIPIAIERTMATASPITSAPSEEGKEQPKKPPKEPERPTDPLKEAGRPKEPQKEAGHPKGPFKESERPKEPSKEAGQPKEPVKEDGRPKEPEKEGRPKEPVKEAGRPKEPVKGADRPKEPVKEAGRPKEPVKEAGRPKEPAKEADRPKEPVKETGRPKEPAKEVGRPKEPAEEVGRPKEPAEEVGRPKEPPKAAGIPKEPVDEADRLKKPVKEGGRPKEPSEEAGRPKKPAKEPERPKEPIEEAGRPKEPPEEAGRPKEPATATSSIPETAKEPGVGQEVSAVASIAGVANIAEMDGSGMVLDISTCFDVAVETTNDHETIIRGNVTGNITVGPNESDGVPMPNAVKDEEPAMSNRPPIKPLDQIGERESAPRLTDNGTKEPAKAAGSPKEPVEVADRLKKPVKEGRRPKETLEEAGRPKEPAKETERPKEPDSGGKRYSAPEEAGGRGRPGVSGWLYSFSDPNVNEFIGKMMNPSPGVPIEVVATSSTSSCSKPEYVFYDSYGRVTEKKKSRPGSR